MMHDGVMSHSWMFGVGWAHLLLAVLIVLVLAGVIKFIFFD
jgi:hypothetical protein